MKLLLINASPHGENSKTLLLARRFIRGLTQNPAIPLERDTFRSYHLQSMNIQECNACHCCWQDEENFTCRIQGDDMNEILSDYRRADLVVWSFPLMFYHFPAAMKRMQERLFVMLSPELVRNQAGYTVHPIGAKFLFPPRLFPPSYTITKAYRRFCACYMKTGPMKSSCRKAPCLISRS